MTNREGEAQMLERIRNPEHLEEVQRRHRDFLVLVFYGEFSAAARRAMDELEQLSRENGKMPIYVVDVQKVKGVHKQFGVKNVPTVLVLEKGKTVRFVEGPQSARFYETAFLGVAPAHTVQRRRRPHRVVVYTGPGCPWCARVKSYLRQHGIAFTEVNVARDRHAAERLVRRSGQMGVPQTEIDGRIVVGFDQPRLNALLGIEPGRE